MNYVEQVLAKYMTPPPMPPEALPPGLVGKAPAIHAAMEIAWKSMGYQMFFNGVTIGAAGVLILIGAVLYRANFTAILRKILTNGV